MYDESRCRYFSESLVSYIAPLRCNQNPPFLKLALHKSALFLASLHTLFRPQEVVKCSDTTSKTESKREKKQEKKKNDITRRFIRITATVQRLGGDIFNIKFG